jgi:hypothetical protein
MASINVSQVEIITYNQNGVMTESKESLALEYSS